MAPDTADLVSAILNDWYTVRHYYRGARSGIGRERRRQAIQKLGLTVREAFNKSDDFEALLSAVIEGAKAKDEPAF